MAVGFANHIGTNRGNIVAKIHPHASGGGPDISTTTATLGGGNPPGDTLHTFTAGGETLEGGTTYWLVLSAPDAMQSGNHYYNAELTNSTAQTGDAGWSIGDRVWRKEGDGAFAELGTNLNRTLSFAVIATPGAGVPQNPRISAVGATEITVNWQAPSGSTAVTGYEVCVIEEGMEFDDTNCPTTSSTSATGPGNVAISGTSTFTYTRTGLTAGTNYIAAVRAIGTHGNSNWIPASTGGNATIDTAAAIARAITGIANTAIAERIAQARAGDSDSINFANILANGDSKAILDGSVLALSSGGGGTMPSFWASGDYLSIGNDAGADEADWDGDVMSIQLGADAKLANGMIAGAALSHSESNIDYEDETDSKSEQDLSLTAIHPYLGWRAGGADMWASIAYGEGDLETMDAGGGNKNKNDATLTGGAFGASIRFAEGARIHGEVSAARLTIDGATGEEDTEADVHRVRFGSQWGRARATAGGGTLRRALDAGVRYDGGDGAVGGGIETSYRIDHHRARRTASAYARVLLAHGDDLREWGAGVSIRHAPGADGQGFSLRMEPSFGATQTRAEQLLDDGAAALTDQSFDPSATMHGEIAYGIALREGIMTPHINFRLNDGGTDYRIGTRYKLRATPLTMGLEAFRNESEVAETGVLFRAGINW